MIAFVALGRLPRWAREAMEQARLSNADVRIVLLHDRPVDGWAASAANRIELYDLRRLQDDRRLRAFYAREDRRSGFRAGFWQHTTGRLFALRAFMERERIDRLTHLENDVLLYAPLTSFAGWLPFDGPGLATVFENGKRAICGVLHVGSRRSLDRLSDFVLAEPDLAGSDDMHRLAAFRLAADGVVGELPTAAPRPDSPSGTTASLFGAAAAPIPLGPGRWLFDGSRLGQYLGGIDPRNSPSRLQRMLRWQRGTLITPNGFINESTDDDPSRYGYAVTRHAGLTVPVLIAHGEQFPIATLHVHSKKLRRFTSPALERYLRS